MALLYNQGFTIALLASKLFILGMNELQLMQKIKLGEISAEKIGDKWVIYSSLEVIK